jgi:hypothetical protein
MKVLFDYAPILVFALLFFLVFAWFGHGKDLGVFALGFCCGIVYNKTEPKRMGTVAYCGCTVNPNGTIQHRAGCTEGLR